jgi:hypothetical protein
MALRADTIAACASAIGAVASAVAAIYALLFLSHQEEIARTQLRATYLSNLFSKQVDGLASLQGTLSEFVERVAHDQIFDATEHDAGDDISDADIEKYYNRIKERYFRYDNVIYTIAAKTEAVYLVMPKSFAGVVERPKTASRNLTSSMKEFIEKKPTRAAFFTFAKDMRENVEQLDEWINTNVDCLRNILAGGQPITDGNVTPCITPLTN